MKRMNHYIKWMLLSATAVLATMVVIMTCAVQTEAKTNWKKLYKDFLENDEWCQEAATSARLINVNNDKIPEIYIVGDCAASGNALLTIYKNKVYINYIDGHGGISYAPKKGLIHEEGGNMGYYFDNVGKLSKGKIVYKKSGSYGMADPLGDSYEYSWEKKEVSEKTYAAKLKKAKGKYKYKNAYSDKKMLDMETLKKKL